MTFFFPTVLYFFGYFSHNILFLHIPFDQYFSVMATTPRYGKSVIEVYEQAS